MPSFEPRAPRRLLVVTAAMMIAIAVGQPQAEARGRGGASSNGAYGLAGGQSPDLALGNVRSGIYGLEYTYDRAHYDFNRCPPPSAAGSQDYTDPDCRR